MKSKKIMLAACSAVLSGSMFAQEAKFMQISESRYPVLDVMATLPAEVAESDAAKITFLETFKSGAPVVAGDAYKLLVNTPPRNYLEGVKAFPLEGPLARVVFTWAAPSRRVSAFFESLKKEGLKGNYGELPESLTDTDNEAFDLYVYNPYAGELEPVDSIEDAWYRMDAMAKKWTRDHPKSFWNWFSSADKGNRALNAVLFGAEESLKEEGEGVPDYARTLVFVVSELPGKQKGKVDLDIELFDEFSGITVIDTATKFKSWGSLIASISAVGVNEYFNGIEEFIESAEDGLSPRGMLGRFALLSASSLFMNTYHCEFVSKNDSLEEETVVTVKIPEREDVSFVVKHTITPAEREERIAALKMEFDAFFAAGDFVGADNIVKQLEHVNVDVGDMKLRLGKARIVKDLQAEFAKNMASGKLEDAEAILDRLAEYGTDITEFRGQLDEKQLSTLLESYQGNEEIEALIREEAEKGTPPKDIAVKVQAKEVERVATTMDTFIQTDSLEEMQAVLDELREKENLSEPMKKTLAHYAEVLKIALENREEQQQKQIEETGPDVDESKPDDEDSEPENPETEEEKPDTEIIDDATDGDIGDNLLKIVSVGAPGDVIKNWAMTSVRGLLDPKSSLHKDGERVQIIGVAKLVDSTEASQISRYEVMGFRGGRIPVTTAFSIPMKEDYVYILGVVRIDASGNISIEEAYRYRILDSEYERTPARPDDLVKAELREWLDFDFLYAVENCFRRFVCVREDGKSIGIISRGEWADENKRTTTSEVEKFLGSTK